MGHLKARSAGGFFSCDLSNLGLLAYGLQNLAKETLQLCPFSAVSLVIIFCIFKYTGSLERNLGILTLKSLRASHDAMTSVCPSGGFSLPQEMAGALESDDALGLCMPPRVWAAWESFMKCVWGNEVREGGAVPFLAQGTQTIPMGTGVSRLSSFHHRCGLGGWIETSPI